VKQITEVGGENQSPALITSHNDMIPRFAKVWRKRKIDPFRISTLKLLRKELNPPIGLDRQAASAESGRRALHSESLSKRNQPRVRSLAAPNLEIRHIHRVHKFIEFL
jgi:hypothetical protein